MRRLIYVIVYTGRFEEMREFYQHGLALPPRHSEEDWIEFDTAGASLALHRMDDPARRGVVLRFEADDLDATLAEFAARGLTPAVKATPMGRLAEVFDPDDNSLSLLEPASPVPSGAGPRVPVVILNVANMEASTGFYRDRFGLNALVQSAWWTEFDSGATRLSLHPRAAAGELRHNAQALVVGFASENLESLADELADRDLEFSAGPLEQRYGRFAEVEDPDGNVVLFRESGPHHAPTPHEVAAAFEDDAPLHAAMRPAGKQHARKTSRVAVKPAYKEKKPAKAAPAKRAKSAPSVRGEGPAGTRRKPLKSSDPERVKTRPAVGHLKKAERRSAQRKKIAVAKASRAKPLKRAVAKRAVAKRVAAGRGAVKRAAPKRAAKRATQRGRGR
jgi:catechol 2,3-dioxygenase-like lactoylglutathione lyase family enzyme